MTSRSKVELRNRSLANPGLLARAGVTISITTDHPVVPIHFLVHQATLSVKHGLDRDTALRALTINPARVAGIDARLGSIEVGKDGDLVIWSGDPLDMFSRVQRALIDGIEIYTEHRRRPSLRHPLTPPGSVRAECRFRAAAIMTSMISTVFPRNLAGQTVEIKAARLLAVRGRRRGQWRVRRGMRRRTPAGSRTFGRTATGSAWRSAAHRG